MRRASSLRPSAVVTLDALAALYLATLSACTSASESPRDSGAADGGSSDAIIEAGTDDRDADADGSAGCTEVDPWVAGHVTAMATGGWRAIHEEDGLVMHGCSGVTSALDCLATYPLASSLPSSGAWGNAMPDATIRILRELEHTTSYRSRSSADGRFVMHGSSDGNGYAVDLARGIELLLGGALYNPSFASDGSGFVMQTSAAQMCSTSVLVDDDPLAIDFREPSCTELSSLGVDVDVAALLGGSDYVAVSSAFTNDRGGAEFTSSDPESLYGPESTLTITPIGFDGTTFFERASYEVPIPFEGDSVVSRSATMVLALHTQDGESSFVLRRLDRDETSGDVTGTTEVGRYCIRGSEPSFSYDDRWVVYHHYVEAEDWADLGYASANDPDFLATRAAGASNLFLLDLATGQTRRITAMGPGQYAVYPHFRSDGWIYAVVRDHVRGHELLIATDSALRLE